LYTLTAALVRAYANIANEMAQAGYSPAETEAIKQEVVFYENLRNEVKLHSGDAIDLKQHEPAMRHLIDTYIRAEPSEKLSAFDDLSLIELIVERGVDAVQALPAKIKASKEATAEAIENNVRKLIIDEQPINPKYYEKMSALLDALIAQRRKEMLEYAEYLRQIVALTKKVKNPETGGTYPERMNTPGKRALYDNLGGDENLASAVHQAVHDSRQDDWRNHRVKVVKVRHAIKAALMAQEGERTATYPQGAGENFDAKVERIIELVGNQSEY
jgi:type I restriction enzyme R subunit